MEQDALDTRNLFKNKRDQYVVEIRKQKKKNTLMEKRVKRIKGGNAESNAQLLGQLFTNKNLTVNKMIITFDSYVTHTSLTIGWRAIDGSQGEVL